MQPQTPKSVDQLPPPDLTVIGSVDHRGMPVNHLYLCTIERTTGPSMTLRFGASDEADGCEGAQDLACAWFEEIAQATLDLIPDARPHPHDVRVEILLTDEATGEQMHFGYDIPPDRQPNFHGPADSVFYRV